MKRSLRLLSAVILLVAGPVCLQDVSAQDVSNLATAKSSVDGSLSATAIAYQATGIEDRKAPFNYILGGNVTFNVKGFVLPFSFTYSNRSSDFRQPFNRFGMSPQYKWATLHLGYRNISYSNYVLNGHTVFGAGLELNPGKYRFAVLYGKLQRKTNTAIKAYSPINDTTTALDRKMLTLKLGYGTENTFVDLIFLKAQDDIDAQDTLAREAGIFGTANLVAGLNTRIKFSNTLHFEAEGAYSIYTSDVNAMPINFDEARQVEQFMPINISTQFYLAIKSSLVYRSRKGVLLAVDYRHIDPGYQSMGIYFTNNDLENITFNVGFPLLKRKMRVKGSLGLERNNLTLARSATTKKVIGSFNLTYNPTTYFGIAGNYSNYSINQSAGRIQIADSIKIYQTTSALMLMPHFQFTGKSNNIQHIINLVYTRMGLNDNNEFTRQFTSFTATNISTSYNLIDKRLAMAYTASLVYNHIEMAVGPSNNYTVLLGATKQLLTNRLSLTVNAALTQSENMAEKFLVFTPTATARFRVGKHHSFSLKLFLISNTNGTDSSRSFNEKTGDFSYVFTF
jgi:hypothetical protein